MQDLVISGNILSELQLAPEELLIDLAVYLYDKERMTMGQAKRLAKISQIEFQKEMSKRGVYIKYDVEDFEEDLVTLKKLDNASSK